MTNKQDDGSTATKTTTAAALSAEQVAVKQLVTIAPAPRTADELAASYAGLRLANMWPEQNAEAVKRRIKELVAAKVLKHGPMAPNKDAENAVPVIELADKQ